MSEANFMRKAFKFLLQYSFNLFFPLTLYIYTYKKASIATLQQEIYIKYDGFFSEQL